MINIETILRFFCRIKITLCVFQFSHFIMSVHVLKMKMSYDTWL